MKDLKSTVFVLEDDFDSAQVLRGHLEIEGYSVILATCIKDFRSVLLEMDEVPPVFILDVMLPDGNGFEMLEFIQKEAYDCSVIMMTAASSLGDATKAMKLGAFDYVSKPLDFDRLNLIVSHALEKWQLKNETKELKSRLEPSFSNLYIGESEAIQKVYYLIDRFAPSNSNILVTGESGTGKELIAKLIHRKSDRKQKPYIVVDCGSLTENFLESELFGHVKGAFTGAIQNKIGLLKEADGGTLFLDEIGEIPMGLQTKLLRFLQEKEFRPIGSNQLLRVDVRIVFATNRDLLKEVEKSEFREDLYYRIHTCNIHLPPLRERERDIPLLVAHFMKKFAGDRALEMEPRAMQTLMEYDWPGNVRELQHVIEHMILLTSHNCLTHEEIPRLKGGLRSKLDYLFDEFLSSDQSLKEIISNFEMSLIERVMDRNNNNITKAAEILKVNRTTLSKKLSRLQSGKFE
ncbi:MAG: sigma-54-dependent Fis family transcriptional regulator [Candidatus Cloacimonetes bacterium]|nr:sigma-54-dependent Fis family transcriptional regulator [Candidatus Cloacimonadota bacterium]